MLSRVRVLRDGPMGQVVKSKGRSLFRARIEAKAKVGDMVAKSKVGYNGPVPTEEEYTDATLLSLHERLAGRTEETPEEEALQPLPPVKLEVAHVPQALTDLAKSAGIPRSRIDPYLATNGIGLLASGDTAKGTTKLTLGMDNAKPTLGVVALDPDPHKPVSKDQLRALLAGFQK